MKKLHLIIVALLGMVAMASGHGYNGHSNHQSELNLKLWNYSKFTVVFDNHTFTKSSQFDLANIKPGVHKLRVIKTTPNKYGYGGLRKVLYNGTINIPVNSEIRAVVNKNRTLTIKVKKKNHNPHNSGYYSNNYGANCDCQNDYNCNHNYEGESFGFYDDYEFVREMSEPRFKNLLRTIKNTSFDATKLLIIKQSLQDNYFIAEQVAIIMNEFTFDNHKLSLAKLAYNKTIDKQNYFIVNEQFTFNSSIKELNHYLSNNV